MKSSGSVNRYDHCNLVTYTVENSVSLLSKKSKQISLNIDKTHADYEINIDVKFFILLFFLHLLHAEGSLYVNVPYNLFIDINNDNTNSSY